MTVDFGIGLRARDPRDLDTYVAEAVRAGFSHLWLYDSPRFAETYVAMTYAALRADRVVVGSLVTNMETRDPAVTANAVATLGLLTGGRVVLGVGLGDSAVKFIGRTPTSFDEFRQRVATVRALLRGERIDYRGRSLVLPARPDPAPPILVAAEGPKTFEFAGACCDGAIVSPGSSPRFLAHAIARIRDGAARAGRDPGALYICAQAHCAVAPTEDQAIAELVGALNRTLYRYVMRVPPPLLGLPAAFAPGALHARAAELTSRQETELEGTDEIRAGLGDDVLRELLIVGTPAACREKIRALLAVDGISQLLVNIHARDRTPALALFREHLILDGGAGASRGPVLR